MNLYKNMQNFPMRIQDKYGKVKVVNCINAHKKIVYKTNTLEMNYDKQKSVYRKKIRFDNFNEITSIKKKQEVN